MLAQPRGKVSFVQRAVVAVEAAQGPRGRAHAEPLDRGEVPVAGDRRRQMQGGRPGASPDPCRGQAWPHDRDLEAFLQIEVLLPSDPFDERAIGRAAAQEDVLAVVIPPAPPEDRRCGSPQMGPFLE